MKKILLTALTMFAVVGMAQGRNCCFNRNGRGCNSPYFPNSYDSEHCVQVRKDQEHFDTYCSKGPWAGSQGMPKGTYMNDSWPGAKSCEGCYYCKDTGKLCCARCRKSDGSFREGPTCKGGCSSYANSEGNLVCQ